MNVEKDDFLLSQIDEFREKAKQLQSLLATKENKVQQLQEIVEEREGKAKELSDMLDVKKDAADRVVAGVRSQIDSMVGQVDAKMKELNETFAERLAENALNSTEQYEEVKKLIDSQNEEIRKIIDEQNEKISETIAGIQEPLEKIKGDLNDKIHTENVKCYRNIQTLFEESDKKTELIKSEVSELLAVKGFIKVASVVSIVNLVGVAALVLHAFGLL
ncbi:MAG: coiled-coil domain-containing protein 22 [Roseburia sp.]|nr:coiled-coil domain-containing protein 22 [Roseburia sp.]